MQSINVAPFIYFRADPSIAGVQSAGFQTVAAATSIPKNLQRDEIEPRLYFDPKSKSMTKVVYFVLSNGQAVLSKATRSHLVGSDNRMGHYLHHGFVLDESDFASLQCNPFSALDRLEFFSSAEQALADSKVHGREMESFKIDVEAPFESAGFDEGWTPDDLTAALTLATSTDALDGQNPIGLVGDTDEIRSFLRGVFDLLPLQLRKQCFFDTDFTGMQSHYASCWAVGMSSPPRKMGSVFIDLKQRTADFPRKAMQDLSAYQLWQQYHVRASRFDQIKRAKEAAWSIAAAIDGIQCERLDDSENFGDVADEVWSLTRDLAAQRFEDSLANQIGSELATRCCKQLCESYPAIVRIRSLQGVWRAADISDHLCEAYLKEPAAPSAEERKQLLALLKTRRGDDRLAAWWFAWERKQEELGALLRRVDARWYLRFSKSVLRAGVVTVERVFQSEHMAEFVDLALYPEPWLDRQQTQQLLKILQRAQRPDLYEKVAEAFGKNGSQRRGHESLGTSPIGPIPHVGKPSRSAPSLWNRFTTWLGRR